MASTSSGVRASSPPALCACARVEGRGVVRDLSFLAIPHHVFATLPPPLLCVVGTCRVQDPTPSVLGTASSTRVLRSTERAPSSQSTARSDTAAHWHFHATPWPRPSRRLVARALRVALASVENVSHRTSHARAWYWRKACLIDTFASRPRFTCLTSTSRAAFASWRATCSVPGTR